MDPMAMSRVLARALLVLLLVAPASAFASGLAGRTYERPSGGGIGPPIPNVALSFVKEDGSAAFGVTTAANGSYSISLAAGRYYVLASHVDYEDYASAPGFAVVVSGSTKGTVNFFLRRPVVTTVLIVRHAEKQDPNSNAQNEPLSAVGTMRAQRLRDTLLRAGISAVYATAARRTQDTVAPLAATFRLQTQTYSSAPTLASNVLAQHRGDVVLVAAHSDTVDDVANAFGAQLPTQPLADYDNLYVVSVAGAMTNVVNLQYGADSTPDDTKNDKRTMTLLLVGKVAASSAPEPQDLRHAARKAGIVAIYASSSSALIAPLATALSLAPVIYNGNDIPAFAAQLVSAHPRDTVLVSGTHEELRALVRQVGGRPFPVLYANDRDHLIVLTRLASGEVRIVPLRF
jgi:phosphohistidine phosphatase SixA